MRPNAPWGSATKYLRKDRSPLKLGRPNEKRPVETTDRGTETQRQKTEEEDGIHVGQAVPDAAARRVRHSLTYIIPLPLSSLCLCASVVSSLPLAGAAR